MQIKSLISYFSKLSGRLPLRVVLIVPFIIQLLTVVGLIWYLSFSNGQKAITELTGELRNEITTRIEQHLLSYLKTPHLINQINADTLRLGALDYLSNEKEIQHLFWQQLQMFDSASYISFASEQGQYIGAERRENKTSNSNKKEQFYLYTVTAEYLANSEGYPEKLTSPIENYKPYQRPWYINTVKANKPIWSEIYALLDANNFDLAVTQTVSANQPFYGNDGKLKGVLGTDIFLSQISDFLRELRIGKTGKTFIMERSGMIVASSTEEKPYLINPKNKEVQRLDAQHSKIPEINHSFEYLIKHFKYLNNIKVSKHLEFELDGQRQYLQVKPLQDERGIDWLIVVIIPEADFMEHINANTRTTIFLCFAALLIAILISLLISKWPVMPVLRLNSAAQKLMAGKWKQDLPTERSDEIGNLARSFKSMATQLQEVFEDLEKVNKAYERFVPREFLKLLDKQSVLEINLGDQVEKEMTVLFLDVRGFTSISEKMTPQDNFEFINSYLGQMEPVIYEYHGVIDKYIGDAIMALFPTNADDAVAGSVAMLKKLYQYNITLQSKGQDAIKIGIGLHTGKLMLGTIGGLTRMEGTVISDAVNLASRIEGMTKQYGASLLISEVTYSNLTNASQYLIRDIDKVKVKGKSKPVTVYEVFDGDLPEILELKKKTLANFEQGIALYRCKEFSKALDCFNKVLQIYADDKATQIYVDRCKYYHENGVPDDWTGVEVLSTK
ncbi:adenylate/guanylate cyclase domain-containing protein [Candidatus Halobeggiatoa sp. HSG11]|nr:adenylate/guanylate cyclase domain-containing protein [Candidatus Halobeggiatoa sp. HSG11]